ncbi:hypothetical protein OHB26_38770 (plasmid) [Nocardia sp. NBC_01503]|uniref:hypothetical protein n=1 Tax=Nocardia sp. NBC_01503 TaxID=2975997 RepID=UPI002E7B6DB9|nr:hypothetical protein [Nocardia sp. NBC_01503]WTL36622.1 hypothetical protein OHB26_38770 [Nocardia sp. NBC_01503]
MATTPRQRIALAAVAAVVIAAGLALVLTNSHHGESGDTRGGDAAATSLGPQPDGADPATAAKYALAAMFSWQPAHDSDPGQGLTRATPWLTGELAAEATATAPATGVRPLRDWAGWATAADVVTALVTITGTGAPEHGQCLVTAQVQQIVLHRNGTRDPTPWRLMTIAASVSDTPAGWRLANYRVTG